MIRGHKESANFVTYTGDGHKVEGACHQCAHCGYTWEYKRGSGIRRGYCTKCDGFICGREECELEQRRLLALFSLEYGCMPWDDVNKRLLDLYAKDARFTVLPSGIVTVEQTR